MIKVGQKYLFEEKQTFEVMYILGNKMILYSKEKGAYDYNKYWLEEELEDGKTRLIEDVPSVEEQLKELCWTIGRTTSEKLKYDMLFFEKKVDVNTTMEVSYDFYTRKMSYSTYCIIGRNYTPFINLEENELILQYIEENEK